MAFRGVLRSDWPRQAGAGPLLGFGRSTAGARGGGGTDGGTDGL